YRCSTTTAAATPAPQPEPAKLQKITHTPSESTARPREDSGRFAHTEYFIGMHAHDLRQSAKEVGVGSLEVTIERVANYERACKPTRGGAAVPCLLRNTLWRGSVRARP